ncbi:MAG: spermidine/putrescine ABC transporter substrate-binding protein [Archaeoglobaceae archaeon]|nr:spermidine/putrescine ABC transporter substrate-binding protein [Archaeoglobaceae archaeon]MCX8151976.1 spermidine/putrescine ABC transporter substrate-binding protein [Archaeoglobaceae archaeon]MDW8013365.1 spermidine/putrescine ABC transporter substrate-binding protein [Archaeoglobaceae archaeon]
MINENRRRFLKLAAIGLAVTFTGCAAFERREERELKICNWSYYIHEPLLDEFAKISGIPRDKIVYDEYDDPSVVLTKLLAGRTGYDVIILPAYCVDIAVRKRLLKEIDWKKVPNIKNVDEKFRYPSYDPEGKYSVVYMWGSTGFAWRHEVEEGVTTLKQIFDPDYGFLPKYRKKITMLEEATEVFCFAKAYLGKDPEDWSDKTLEEVREVLLRQKPYLATYGGASIYFEGLKKGSIWVSQAYSGDIARLMEEFEGVNFGIPEEGGTIWTDSICIPLDAKNIDAAHEFINFLLDPNVASRNSLEIYYANPLKRELVEESLAELFKNPVVYPPEDLIKKMWFEPSLSDELREKINNIMIEIRAA